MFGLTSEQNYNKWIHLSAIQSFRMSRLQSPSLGIYMRGLHVTLALSETPSRLSKYISGCIDTLPAFPHPRVTAPLLPGKGVPCEAFFS